jgi:hypothetical protein
MRRWSEATFFNQIHRTLLDELNAARRIDWLGLRWTVVTST